LLTAGFRRAKNNSQAVEDPRYATERKKPTTAKSCTHDRDLNPAINLSRLAKALKVFTEG
jgi:hypothetical protein